MKKLSVSSLIALALVSISGLAQSQTTEPASTLSFNVGATTDYRYRGLTQTTFDPALQGGVDYADKSGFYLGAWGSTINWIKDAGTITGRSNVTGPVELDLYAGYKGTMGDIAYDVGFLRYEYVGNKLKNSVSYGDANTNEIYGALTMGVVTAKYSHALSNLFGNLNSKNSYYLDLSANVDLGNGFSLVPHVGYQKLKGAANADGSYTDYSLTVSKDLGNGLSASAAFIGTDAKDSFYYTPAGKGTGKSGVTIGLKYAF
ncbi:MAG: hypothetical protein RIT44_1369 [Pseudomonadota bacterium]|jgi:uncharacterized protein (TIGR02001 family)